MELRISKKVETHQIDFKNAIKSWMESHSGLFADTQISSEFLKYIYDYDNIVFAKEDFLKRKRVKNIVPQYERCTSLRANGEQCTRRRKDSDCFCGTHIKGTPHGVVAATNTLVKKINKVEIWIQEIQGINYYIDAANNAYLPDDILANIDNPRKIGRWELDKNNMHNIPMLE